MFGDEVLTVFVSHIEVFKVLISSLFMEVKLETKDLFKVKKACHDKVFTSCATNLRADLLLKSSPFSVLLFQQSGHYLG